jgi:ferritin-like metal-binding protein YciE
VPPRARRRKHRAARHAPCLPGTRRTLTLSLERTMAMNNLQDLLKHELGDLLYAEKTVLKGIKKMRKEVKNPMLNDRLAEHYAETEQQIRNVEAAFETFGAKAKAEKCPGILGLMEEHDEFEEEEKPSDSMLEAFDIGSALRIEHYEIAAYTTSIAIARTMGNAECVRLLSENLEQEVAMEKFLRANAVKALKLLDAQADAEEAEESAGKSSKSSKSSKKRK